MKSMNKSFLGASIILAVLSGCASKQAQQPELTLSGLNPANFEVSAENTKPIKLYTLKNSGNGSLCNEFRRTNRINHGSRQKWKDDRCRSWL